MRCAVASIPCTTWTFVTRGFSETPALNRTTSVAGRRRAWSASAPQAQLQQAAPGPAPIVPELRSSS